MISHNELEYFLECANTGNLSRAAERLGITQPTITVALRRLESEIGTELFHRSKKGVRLTKAGEIFLRESQGFYDQWLQLAKRVKSPTSEISGHLSIGCHPSVALYSLPQTLPELLSDFPELHLELKHGLSRDITSQVIQSEIDLGIVVNPVRHPDLVIRSLCKDEVCFWSSKITSKINSIDSKDLVLLFNPDMTQAQTLLRKAKLAAPRNIHSDSLESIAALAEAGAGIAILPTRVAKHWKNLKRLPLPHFEDELTLLYRSENRNILALRELAKRLEKGMA